MNFNVNVTEMLNLTFMACGLGICALVLTAALVDSGLTLYDLIKVELLAGAAGADGVVSGRLDAFDEFDWRRRGFDELLFVVRASNIGRKTTDVVQWSIVTSRGWDYSLEEFRLNPELPYPLKPGTAVNFYVPMEQVFAAVYATAPLRGLVRRICASVRLRNGTTRRSRMYELPAVSLSQTENAASSPNTPSLVERSVR